MNSYKMAVYFEFFKIYAQSHSRFNKQKSITIKSHSPGQIVAVQKISEELWPIEEHGLACQIAILPSVDCSEFGLKNVSVVDEEDGVEENQTNGVEDTQSWQMAEEQVVNEGQNQDCKDDQVGWAIDNASHCGP